MFIISLTYQVSLQEVDRFIPEHIEFLNEQYAKGHFILSGRKEPRTGGVIISIIKSREELEAVLVKDPFYREKLASYDVTQIVPTKASDTLKFLAENC
ncbi:GTP cyclohydrolase [Pseudoalteromonas sp. JBTF-M23]|uniref:GTP cyclohydrolase n=1 Tax=Pseudoalteromonas caenipelagi TaxID=2726988 RepID=A0A849VBS5_9GAMM|nr:YciI family protein [Pseudoalteromonas caenipelagi]NOU49247.1 GTP cyclohydrolase [Pseudoalteromonas caenipelagi]